MGSRARGGSGVVRLRTITSQLEQSVRAGHPVKHCRNCGEIKTPTWRPYWTRVHEGDANDLDVKDLCGIHMFEVLSKNEEGKTTRYRVYKQFSHLTQIDKAQNLYEQYTFCNRKSTLQCKYFAFTNEAQPVEIGSENTKPSDHRHNGIPT
jgi:hypothetical protein